MLCRGQSGQRLVAANRVSESTLLEILQKSMNERAQTCTIPDMKD
jgi:hypothetical protein